MLFVRRLVYARIVQGFSISMCIFSCLGFAVAVFVYGAQFNLCILLVQMIVRASPRYGRCVVVVVIVGGCGGGGGGTIFYTISLRLFTISSNLYLH